LTDQLQSATTADDHELVPPAAAAPVAEPAPDPRRWVTLSILITAVVLIAVDVSVLNVSIPTILRDLDTTVPSLEWVITGYSLTFATFLIIGGRLGDIYGHRRMFIIGAALFGTGSFIASISPSVGVLIVGEAVVEGIGAAVMLPATLAILSTTFRGRERATAFAMWGATMGAAVAFGPVLGGFLTTNYSWRWSFRINVIVAPLAILGALLLIPKGIRKPRTPIDLPGAAMIASGMFLLVFALSEGSTYGYWSPTQDFDVGSLRVWTSTAPISVATVAFVVAIVILFSFVVYERGKERRGTDPLFELSQFKLKTFRYGLLTVAILSMGQLGVLFALPLFLQEAEHLSAEVNGLWLLPLGLAVVVGAQIGGRLTRRITPTSVARIGLFVETFAYLLIVHSITADVTFWQMVPGLIIFGLGLGFATSQITNVILSEVPIEKSGVASGANSTARQLGVALGAAIIGSLITVQTINHAVAALATSPMSAPGQASLRDAVQAMGPNTTIPPGTGPADAAAASHVLADAVAAGTRTALMFGAAVVFGGALLSLLIPRIKVTPTATTTVEVFETFDDLEPVVPDPREVLRD
jgi:EmrB/QacA subfamily drug resistance transporter